GKWRCWCWLSDCLSNLFYYIEYFRCDALRERKERCTLPKAIPQDLFYFLAMMIAVLGAVYSGSGLFDKRGRFFENLTEYLIFGFGGGFIIGIGFGVLYPLFSIFSGVDNSTLFSLPHISRFWGFLTTSFASLSVGITIGIILGILTRW